jgi:adenosylhomocysteine nucleosidase
MTEYPAVAIVMATLLEAKPFVEGMFLKKSEKKPFDLFRDENTILIISGIGKSNAAMASAYCCQKFNPACICNLGAAGATLFSHSLGDILHIREIFEYDRPDFRSGKPHIHRPDTLKGFQTADLATGDKAILDPDERKKISRYAGLVDMEGASVAQACRKFHKSCYMFKFVSDTPDHTRDEDIVKNIRLYRKLFCEFFISSVMPALLNIKKIEK